MKAVILAGGKGTRGKPYTDYFPKAMIPVNGKPLIHHVIDYLLSFDIIADVIIISDFRGIGGQIKNYFKDSSYKNKIKYVQDAQCGTAGDLVHIQKLLQKNREFVLWFVDNLCAVNLDDMRKQFVEKDSLACIATRSKRKEETGFAVIENGIINEFKEKPIIKMQMSECLGVYMLDAKILKIINSKLPKKNLNLSFDVLQELSKIGRVSSYDIGNKSWLDVESPIVLERNESVLRKIIKEMKH